MTHAEITEFVGLWGMVFFIILFVGVLAYVVWPKSRQRFKDAANIPFKED
ncbi:MAG: cbb3-type cytochrome c oxidase subunit 3 [Rhodospirillales bacterium]